MKKVFGVAGLAAAAWLLGSPYITVYQMKVAAQEQDGEALSGHVEFPTLRQSLKDKLKAAMVKEMAEQDDNPFAGFGMAMSGMMVEGIVDSFVTPAGLIAMMDGEKPLERRKSPDTGNKEAFTDARIGYKSWNRFAISMDGDRGDEVTFILRRRGLGWKLTDMHIPVN